MILRGGVLARCDFVVELEPKIVIILIGTNDITHNIPQNEILENYNSIIEKLYEISNVRLCFVSVLPTSSMKKNLEISTINSELEKLCDKRGIDYIDAYNLMVSDEGVIQDDLSLEGLHLNKSGYDILVECIKKYVENTF